MMKELIVDPMYPTCPLRNVLARVFEKWSLIVICELSKHPDGLRTGELAHAIPDVSNRVLTATLRKLEADGLVHREVFPEVPPRVEYSLTDRARSLLPLVEQLVNWSLDNYAGIIKDRENYLINNK